MPSKALTLVGPVPPVIRLALAAFHGIELRDSAARGLGLISEALASGAVAVIAPRLDVADLCGPSVQRVLVVGVSTGGWDALVCRNGAVEQVPNPTPEAIAALIRDWADGIEYERSK